METKDISARFWDYVETQKAMGRSKEAKQVYKWLNYDNLGSIQLDNDIFWIELTCSTSTLPKYVFEYIKRWASLLNYKYLYDINN